MVDAERLDHRIAFFELTQECQLVTGDAAIIAKMNQLLDDIPLGLLRVQTSQDTRPLECPRIYFCDVLC